MTQSRPKKKDVRGRTWAVALAVAAVIVIIGAAAYMLLPRPEKVDEEEIISYVEAMRSDDERTLRSYLETYTGAPREHIDSVQMRLDAIGGAEREWNDVLVSGSRTAIANYLNTHPDTRHRREALHVIDSLDWDSALSANTQESLRSYIDAHPDGEYADEASIIIHEIGARTVTDDERQMVVSVFNLFFQGINTRDEDRLTSTVCPLMTTFLGKQNATRSDVLTFMKKLWKDGVTSLDWRSTGDFQIEKKEVGEDKYELFVTFSAQETAKKGGETLENSYRIKARVSPEGMISELNMSRMLE